MRKLFMIAVIGAVLGGIAITPLSADKWDWDDAYNAAIDDGYSDEYAEGYAEAMSRGKSKAYAETYATAFSDVIIVVDWDWAYANAYAHEIAVGKSKSYARKYAEAYSKTATEASVDAMVNGTNGKLATTTFSDIYASAYARKIADGGNETDARAAAVRAASRAVAEAE